MKWISGFLLVVGFLVAGLMGVYVPLTIYRQGDLVSAALAGLAMIVAGIVGFFTIVFSGVSDIVEREERWYDRDVGDRLKAYRARQRAMLEELDEMVGVLREIRDLLKYEGEGSG